MESVATRALLDSPAGPLPQAGRVAVVDTLRSLALFGVIVMNVVSMVMMLRGDEVMASATVADMAIGTADLVLLQGKARSCFALLFGIGFGVLLQRAGSAGAGFNAFFLRRMAVLLLFGLVNQLFLFWGDILVLYALVGASLPLFRHWGERRLLGAAALLIVGVPLLHGVIELVAGPLPSPMSRAEGDALIAAALTAFQQPVYGLAVIEANASLPAVIWGEDLPYKIVYTLGVLGLFLLGLVIARRGILFEIDRHRPLLARVALLALPIGLALSILRASSTTGWEPGMPWAALVTAAYCGFPIMALGYAAALALLLRARGQWLVRLLAPAGRMALTNYLASGLVGALALYGYGLGLLERAGMASTNLLAVGIFVVLLALSHAWLRVFRHGPAEWLWRTASYGRAPPMWRDPPGSPSIP